MSNLVKGFPHKIALMSVETPIYAFRLSTKVYFHS